jgi:hypothetical protein
MGFEIAVANRRLIRANISWAICRIPVPPFVVIVKAGKWPARRLL